MTEFMNAGEAAKFYEVSGQTFIKWMRHGLVEAEAIDGGPRGYTWRIRVDGGIAEVWQRYLANFPEEPAVEDFASYRRVRRMLKLDSSLKHTDRMYQAAVDFEKGRRGHASRKAVQQLLGGTRRAHRGLQSADTADMTRRYRSNIVKREHEGTPDDLRKFLPPALGAAPGTAMCPHSGDDYPWIGERTAFRIMIIQNEKFRAALALFALYKASLGQSLHAIFVTVTELAFFDEALTSCDVTDPADVDATFRAYLFDKALCESHPDRTRFKAYLRFNQVREMVVEYVESLPAPLRAQFLPYVPAAPKADANFRARLSSLYPDRGGEIGVETRRKNSSDPVAQNLDGLRYLAEMRVDATRRMFKAFSAETSLARGSREEFPICFSYDDAPRGNDGRALGDSQDVHCRLWSLAALHRAQRDAGDTAWGKKRLTTLYDPAHEDLMLIEYVGVSPRRPGGRTEEPWFISLVREGVIDGYEPTDLEHRASLRQARQDVGLKTLGPMRGLLGFDGRTLRTSARRFKDIGGKLIVPIAEFHHAMLLARIAVRSMTVNGARLSETIQMTQNRSLWASSSVDGQLRRSFLAIPKGWKERRPFFIDADTMDAVVEAKTLAISRWFADTGELPIFPPAQRLEAKAGPDRFIFATENRTLAPEEVNRLIQVLAVNYLGLTSHDLRHAFANVAAQEGVDGDILALFLSHKNRRTTSYYSRPTQQQIDREMSRFIGSRTNFEVIPVRSAEGLEQEKAEQIARFGSLKRNIGGECMSSFACDKDYDCIGCVKLYPDPSRREDLLVNVKRLEEDERRFLASALEREAAKCRRSIERHRGVLAEMDAIEDYRAARQKKTVTRRSRPTSVLTSTGGGDGLQAN